MQANLIVPGMTLRLKDSRQSDYGMDNPFVKVTEIVERKGYSVPWIKSGADFFKPSDFVGEAC